MRPISRWSALSLVALLATVASCSGGDDDPIDPGPDQGEVRVTVTGDGSAMAGVTTRLFADGGVVAVETGTTAANGQLTFGVLDEGSYDVDIVLPAGFELVTGALRRDVIVSADQTTTVTFALEEIEVLPTEGSVRVRVLEDGDGVPDVEVLLFETDGVVPIETGQTLADGRVFFGNLAPGNYEVAIEMPPNFESAPGDTTHKDVAVTAGVITDKEFEIVSTLVGGTVEISASGSAFAPSDVTVAPGTTVRWVKGVSAHTVSPSGHTEWAEATLDTPGETFEHTFDAVGTFNYLCEFHDGMTGVVRVQS